MEVEPVRQSRKPAKEKAAGNVSAPEDDEDELEKVRKVKNAPCCIMRDYHAKETEREK